MKEDLVQLYPDVGSAHLKGLYLNAALVPAGHAGPFVYSNFVSSLDGRIAIRDPADDQLKVPPQTANARDWRLFQELAAHADCLLTSGRYMRELASGRAQDVPPLGPQPEFDDLREHRIRRGQPAQPDVAVVSASLDFPPPRDLCEAGRGVLILTTSQAPEKAAEAHRAAGARIIRLPDRDGVNGARLIAALAEAGYRKIYAATGGQLLGTLVQANVLDCLFLTTVARLIGGMPATTLLETPVLPEPMNFSLTSLYYDGTAPQPCGQLLARYDRAAQ